MKLEKDSQKRYSQISRKEGFLYNTEQLITQKSAVVELDTFKLSAG